MKKRQIKTLNSKYGNNNCDNIKFYNMKEDAETLFNYYDYIGYLYIPKMLSSEISRYLSEADDNICVQNHLNNYFKTKVVKITDLETEVVFINYHMNELCFCTIKNIDYIVEGNVLKKIV